jgi:hypothetical protein
VSKSQTTKKILPDNPELPKLLRAIASSTDAKKLKHDIIFNLAAEKCEAYDKLKGALLDYLSEIDNPVSDYTFRLNLRDYLRKLVGAPPARKS